MIFIKSIDCNDLLIQVHLLFDREQPSKVFGEDPYCCTWPHSVLTRGALGEVVNLTKPMIESGLGGLDRPCARLIPLCSSHLGHFYGQKLPKMAIFGYIGHKRVLDAPNGWNEVEQGWNK